MKKPEIDGFQINGMNTLHKSYNKSNYSDFLLFKNRQ